MIPLTKNQWIPWVSIEVILSSFFGKATNIRNHPYLMVLECFHNKPPIFEVLYNPYLMFKLRMVSSCFTMLSVPFKPCRTGGISLVPWDVDVVIPPFYEAPIPDKIIVGHRYIHHIHISHIVRIYIHTHTSHIYIYIYIHIYIYIYIYT